MAQYEIYTTGGGDLMVNTFNFVAAYMNTQDYAALISLGIMVGTAAASMKMMWGEGYRDTFKWFTIASLITSLGIGSTASVVIFDKTKSEHPIAIVDNVPYILAVVAHGTTSMGYHIAEQLETLIQTPDDLAYQKNGMYFGNSLLSQSTRWNYYRAKVQSSYHNFFKSCMFDAANIGLVDWSALTGSRDLKTFLPTAAPQSLAFYDERDNQVKACNDSGDLFGAQLGTTRDTAIKLAAAGLLSKNVTETIAQKRTRVEDSMDALLQTLAGSSMTATDYMAQSVLVQLLDESAMGYISDANNAAAMDRYMRVRAEAQTVASYQAAGMQAQKWVPLLKVVFEIIYIGFFPIALFLCMTPMAVSIAKSYLLGWLWLSLWEPISAILNSIVVYASQNMYNAAGLVATANGTYSFGLNFSNIFSIRSVEADIGAMAGGMSSLVPFIAISMLYGASKLASASTAMTNISQTAATDIGKEYATGNHSLGNISLNNVGANKYNASRLYDAGRSSTVSDHGTMITTNPDGSTHISSGTAHNQLPNNLNLRSGLMSSASQRVEQAKSHSTSLREQERASAERTTGVTSEIMDSSQKSDSFTDAGGKSFTASQKETVSEATQRIDDFAKRHDVTRDTAINAGLKVSLGVGKLAKAGINADGSTRAVSAENYSKLVKAAQSEGISNDIGKVEEFRKNSGYQTSDSWSLGENYSQRDLIQESKSISQERARATEEVERATEARDYLTQSSLFNDQSLTNQYLSFLRTQHGMSTLEASKLHYSDKLTDADEVTRLSNSFFSHMMTRNMGPSALTSHMATNYPTPNSDRTDRFVEDNSVTNPTIRKDDQLNKRRDEVTAGIEGLKTKAAGQKAAIETTTASVRDTSEVERSRNLADHLWQRTKNAVTGKHDQYEGNSYAGLDGQPYRYDKMDADMITRTMLAEAGGQGDRGLEAVAHVMRNRTLDARFPNKPSGVVMQDRQFSAWNSGAGGNSIGNSISSDSPEYKRAHAIAQDVFTGQREDITSGATHYYSPAGMEKLVEDGHQTNIYPHWLTEKNAERGEAPFRVGGHIFTGRANLPTYVEPAIGTGFRYAPGTKGTGFRLTPGTKLYDLSMKSSDDN